MSTTTPPPYAELHCLSNFSFQRGASHAHELVQRAHELGYTALAITDECSLAGVVRAYQALRDLNDHLGLPAGRSALQLLIGAEFTVQAPTPFRLVVLACHLEGYGGLSEFITGLRRASPKGSYRLELAAVRPEDLPDCVLLLVPRREATFDTVLAQARSCRGARRPSTPC